MSTNLNFQSIFESVPGLYLILSPTLVIVAVSDNYLKATMTNREEIVGRHLFDVFPDNPDDPDADGVSNLHASLNHVLHKKEMHKMNIQKYDIRKVDGSFEERYWSPVNKPVVNSSNEIEYIIHCVEDVTVAYNSNLRSKATKLLLHSSIESLKDMVILSIDRNFNYLNFNSVHKNLTKQVYGIEIHPGMNMLYHLTNEEDRKKVITNFERAFAGEWHTTIENYGSIEQVCFETRYNPIINDRNEIIGATAFAIDISERIKAEAEIVRVNKKLVEAVDQLQKSNELFSQLFDWSPASIVISRLDDFKIYDANVAFMKLFGFSNKEEILGKTAEELNVLTDPELRDRIIEAVRKYGKADNIEGSVRTRSGRDIWVSNSVQLVEILGVKYTLTVTLDITTIREQKKQLEDQSEKLNLVNQELEAFSYSVSHDLKAPLRALQGFSKALYENYHNSLEGESLRWLRFIESNANRMGFLIDDILSFSRVGRASLQRTEINMKFLVREVFDMEKLQYGDHNIEFILGDLPVAVGDSAMLKLVWQNLVSNALKYSSKQKNVRIEVKGKTDDAHIIYSISDNGVGFDEKYKEKLFGVFQRLHSNDEFEGTGVGLAIAQKIIQKHGGWITAIGELGKGTQFNFAIPI